MSSFISKFRRKKTTNELGTTNGNSNKFQNDGSHRDSLSTDHIFIPQQNGSFLEPPPADIGSGSDHEGIQIRKRPQLAYSLDRLLVDSSALSYFIQFLESCDKLNLIKFWMHVEGFKASFSDGIPAAQELSLRDAKSIYEKYVDDGSTATLALPKKIREIVEDEMLESPLKKTCFDDAQHFVRQLFEYRYFEEFQSSVYYKKHELEVLSGGCSLSEILKVQTLLTSFLEFINDKEDHDIIQFLLGCDSFEAHLDEMEDADALGDAMALYDKYFSMQASNMIDLGQAIRSELESMICDESGRPHRKSFRNAKTACYYKLHDKYIQEFTRSAAYHTYLTELTTFIENTIELPRRYHHHRRQRSGSGSGSAASDAPSSTDSLTTAFSRHLDILEEKLEQQTPQATPTSSRRSTPRTPRSSRLAEIDELGRYHALYDDSHAYSQTTKTPMRIKSKLRKYLDKNTLREEEIAEEVARTIIRDMQNIIAASSSSSSHADA